VVVFGRKLESSLDFVRRELNLYPLWNCPIKPDTTTYCEFARRSRHARGITTPSAAERAYDLAQLKQMLNPTDDPLFGVLVDVGVWGMRAVLCCVALYVV
jgi:hypothetical protein